MVGLNLHTQHASYRMLRRAIFRDRNVWTSVPLAHNSLTRNMRSGRLRLSADTQPWLDAKEDPRALL